jgi:hypothetical protein
MAGAIRVPHVLDCDATLPKLAELRSRARAFCQRIAESPGRQPGDSFASQTSSVPTVHGHERAEDPSDQVGIPGSRSRTGLPPPRRRQRHPPNESHAAPASLLNAPTHLT